MAGVLCHVGDIWTSDTSQVLGEQKAFFLCMPYSQTQKAHPRGGRALIRTGNPVQRQFLNCLLSVAAILISILRNSLGQSPGPWLSFAPFLFRWPGFSVKSSSQYAGFRHFSFDIFRGLQSSGTLFLFLKPESANLMLFKLFAHLSLFCSVFGLWSLPLLLYSKQWVVQSCLRRATTDAVRIFLFLRLIEVCVQALPESNHWARKRSGFSIKSLAFRMNLYIEKR